MNFPILNGLQPLDTPEKEEAYRLALEALTQRQKNPDSRLWRMREKQALYRLEKLYGRYPLFHVLFEGIVYPSSENAFQAAKSMDPQVRLTFANPDISSQDCAATIRLGSRKRQCDAGDRP